VNVPDGVPVGRAGGQVEPGGRRPAESTLGGLHQVAAPPTYSAAEADLAWSGVDLADEVAAVAETPWNHPHDGHCC
jgi:hypothetical protein